MDVPRLRTLLVSTGMAGAAVALVAAPAAAAGGISPIVPDGVSPNGRNIHDLYQWISIPAILIFLLVEILLFVIVVRFRRSRRPPGFLPPQWHGNHRLELAWTIVPLVIVLAISAASFVELQNDFTKRTDAETNMDITITAYQFGWEYSYPEGFKVDSIGLNANPMVVPTGKLVRLRMQSRDVIHSWWVPSVTGKTDAVPGYDNYTWLKIDSPGEWRGECAELCGAGHYSMQLRVQAMDEAGYGKWVADQKKAAQPKPSASPSAAPSASPSASPGATPAPSASPAPSPSPSR